MVYMVDKCPHVYFVQVYLLCRQFACLLFSFTIALFIYRQLRYILKQANKNPCLKVLTYTFLHIVDSFVMLIKNLFWLNINYTATQHKTIEILLSSYLMPIPLKSYYTINI